ncbi:TPA: DUF4368 domain-containing protein [Clostridioides difficile]
MEPNRREFIKQCAFQKFCNTVLHNEACDAHKELHRHKEREVTFSDLSLDEARQLHTFDEYFKRETAETVFEKAGKKITPKLLLEAIRTLPEEKRKAVLLYYFEGMNDTEIAELTQEIDNATERSADVKRFVALVRRYTAIEELTYENVHEFIDRILIHELDKETNTRKIEIFYSFVGRVDTGDKPTESISYFRQIGADVKSYAI